MNLWLLNIFLLLHLDAFFNFVFWKRNECDLFGVGNLWPHCFDGAPSIGLRFTFFQSNSWDEVLRFWSIFGWTNKEQTCLSVPKRICHSWSCACGCKSISSWLMNHHGYPLHRLLGLFSFYSCFIRCHHWAPDKFTSCPIIGTYVWRML